MTRIQRVVDLSTVDYDKLFDDFHARFDGTKYETNDTIYQLMKRRENPVYAAFLELVIENGLNVSQSPYSESFYAFEGNDFIGWGHKPENSYRVSNHWNFDGHCPTICGTQDKIMIAIFQNGTYREV